MTQPTRSLILGTRASALARWQTDHIQQLLQTAWPDLNCRQLTFTTQGDRQLETPLPQIGGKGLFTLELEQALHAGQIDLAVHSLKDLPIDSPPGLTLGAIVGRADVRDVLIARQGVDLLGLPPGALVGTSSLRRQAQVRAYRHDLRLQAIRGNVDTRLRKVWQGDYDAAILAGAGLTRLGLTAAITQWLPLTLMLPAPGQGALAVQCRAADADALRRLAALDNPAVRACVSAERAFLQALGGGCATPVAAYARLDNGQVSLTGRVSALDGSRQLTLAGQGDDPWQVGTQLARQALAEGASELLAYVL